MLFITEAMEDTYSSSESTAFLGGGNVIAPCPSTISTKHAARIARAAMMFNPKNDNDEVSPKTVDELLFSRMVPVRVEMSKWNKGLLHKDQRSNVIFAL